jgi:hypothetical protein
VRLCLLTLIAFFAVGSVAALAWAHPWCGGGGISDSGAPSCGFASLEQCRAVSTRCTQNPLTSRPDRQNPPRGVSRKFAMDAVLSRELVWSPRMNKAFTLAATIAAIGLTTLMAVPAAAQCYNCNSTYSGPGYYPPGGYSAGYYHPAFTYPRPSYDNYYSSYGYYPAPVVVPNYDVVPFVYGIAPLACGAYDRHCPRY